MLEPKGTLGIVIMSNNAPVNVVTVMYGRGIMMNLHSILCKVDANSNKLFVLLEPHSSFRFQYRLLTMTTFSELAVTLKCAFVSVTVYTGSLRVGSPRGFGDKVRANVRGIVPWLTKVRLADRFRKHHRGSKYEREKALFFSLCTSDLIMNCQTHKCNQLPSIFSSKV